MAQRLLPLPRVSWLKCRSGTSSTITYIGRDIVLGRVEKAWHCGNLVVLTLKSRIFVANVELETFNIYPFCNCLRC
jgi:hypothetical protein